MKRSNKVFGFVIFCWIGLVLPSEAQTKITEDIKVMKLTEKSYLYVASAEIEGWGKVPSNGLILLEGQEAFLFDTPINDVQTQELTDWIGRELNAKVVGFVPNHWHGDCMGGLAYLHSIGVKSYANRMTIDIAREKGLVVPRQGFEDSLCLKLGRTEIFCYYPGGGHSSDNIVVWLPSEKILFGGCLLKDAQTNSLGNLSDAVVEEWPGTVERVLKKFPEAEIVIPGHGNIGGLEIVEHTRDLLLRKKKER